METENGEIEYCNKCCVPTPVLVGSSEQGEQGHIVRYCGDCGAPYDYLLVNLDEIANTLLYKKIGELHNLYFGEDNKDYYNLMSDAAAQVMYRLASQFIIEALKNDFVDEKQKQQIENCAASLTHLYWNVVLDGYFAWIAEQLLSGKEIDTSISQISEVFENECHKTAGVIYEDFIQSSETSQNSKNISRNMSLVLQTFVSLQVKSYFDQIEGLRSVEDIYSNIQATCYQGIVGGYAVGVVDACYRK